MDSVALEKKITAKIAQNGKAIVTSLLNESRLQDRSKVFVSPDCQQIKIVPSKDYDFSHYLILQLENDLNVSILEHSLPDNEKYFKPLGTIETYSATFFSLLEQTVEFYRQMEIIDELCYVVDPEEITTKQNYRVIKLDDRVYMKIKVNPLDPASVTTTFYGPTKRVEHYRKIYHEKLDDWNINDDIYRNFLRIFDLMAFPQKSSFNNCGMGELCSICYTYRFAGQIPIVSCDNDKCALNYHTTCLKTWFATLRDTKVFLNMTSGRCPSCKEKLSTAFNDLLDE
ncbi:E3 ubiquitin-protein ligase FANCL [Contarinia nasturtii]|uniref:E3 ubiquitin-protein ligase FANCL n=1 Tax=Contarinia nasturtii TaxID=265458 RepID=UPI0012D3E8AB|nr:E3 ubiquitin-protein ligase FANCL [Contarinia nasturtii]